MEILMKQMIGAENRFMPLAQEVDYIYNIFVRKIGIYLLCFILKLIIIIIQSPTHFPTGKKDFPLFFLFLGKGRKLIILENIVVLYSYFGVIIFNLDAKLGFLSIALYIYNVY